MALSEFDVFLSYNRDDQPAVNELANRLGKEGIKYWLDRSHLPPGKDWLEGIEKALNSCDTCAVFIGPSGIGPWQKREMHVAINRQVNDGFPVIPVLLPGSEYRVLPPILKPIASVEFRDTLHDEYAFHCLMCGIRGIAPGQQPLSSPPLDTCPYPGLRTFKINDAQFFFGREDLTHGLIDKLRQPITKEGNRFLTVIGNSGSGKSSLVRAGLIPALGRGDLNGSKNWRIVVFRPGPDPLHALSLELAEKLTLSEEASDMGRMITRFKDDSRELHWISAKALHGAPEEQRITVVVDQFEEVFTQCDDECTRTAFIENLLHAASVPQGKTTVILTMRTDFYGKCAAYLNSDLAAAVSDNQMLVARMSEQELRRAIECPAQKVGCDVDAGLVELLLSDVGDQAGTLPLLQHALMLMWKKHAGRQLTVDAYKSIGKLQGALEKHANAIYDEFDNQEKDACKRIFLLLVKPGEDGTADTKHRISREAFGKSDTFDKVIEKLAGARLIITEGEQQDIDHQDSATSFIEISHEALINGWPRYRKWIDTHRRALQKGDQIEEEAKEWVANKRNNDFLLRGRALDDALEWLNNPKNVFHNQAREFVRTSAKLRRKQRITWSIGTSVVALLVIAIGIILHIWHENSQARIYWESALKERDEKKNSLKASHYFVHAAAKTYDRDLEKKARLASAFLVRNAHLANISEGKEDVKGAFVDPDSRSVVAWLGDGSVQQWKNEENSWNEIFPRGEKVVGTDVSDSGKRILTWSDNGMVRVSIDGSQAAFSLDHTGILNAGFIEDHSQIVTVSKDGIVCIRREHDGKLLDKKELDEPISEAVFSVDKRRLLTLSDDGTTVTVWDIGESIHQKERRDMPEPVIDAVFTQDGSKILLWSEGSKSSIYYWDYLDHTPIKNLFDYPGRISKAIFSNDGRTIASWGSDYKVRILNLDAVLQDEEKRFRLVLDIRSEIRGAVFNGDERKILTWSDDGTVQIWDSLTGQPLTYPLQHDGPVQLAGFTANGNQVIAWSNESGSVRIWDTKTDGSVTSPLISINNAGTKQAAFVKGEHSVVTLSGDGKVQIWKGQRMHTVDPDTFKGKELSRDGRKILVQRDKQVQIWDILDPNPEINTRVLGEYEAATFSGDGNHILAWRSDKMVDIWDSDSGKSLASLNALGNKGILSKDNSRFMTWSEENTAIWDVQKQEKIDEKAFEKPIKGAIFGPDPDRVFVWLRDVDGRAGYWDTVRKEFSRVVEHSGPIGGAALSDNGKRVVTWKDNTAYLWDSSEIRKSKVSAKELQHNNFIQGASFSNDSRLVITWSDDHTARVWASSNGQPLTPGLRHNGPVKGVVIDHDDKRILTWNDNGPVRVWDIGIDNEIRKQDLILLHEIRTGFQLDPSHDDVRMLTVSEWKVKKNLVCSGTVRKSVSCSSP